MIPVRALLRRPPALLDVRDRLERERSRPLSEATLAAMARVQTLKLELAEASGHGHACSRCARGCDGAAGRFDGGLCCSGATRNVFSEIEIAVLAKAGARPRHYRASGANAGCVFRGSRGCNLGVEHRPSICVHYICSDLMAEIADRGQAKLVAAAQDRLVEVMRSTQASYERERRAHDFDELFEAPA